MKLPQYLSFLNKSFMLLVFYIFLSGIMMNFSDEKSLSGIRWTFLQMIETVDGVKETFTIRRNLSEENESLKAKFFELSQENQELREMLVSENQRLKRMLELKEKAGYEYIAARIIANSTEKGFRSVILDVGTNDGVSAKMAVINADGLIGKVIITESSQSVVQLLMDFNANVSVKLQNSRENGIVSWTGNSWLDLNYIPKNIPVENGEWVVTSGLSSNYPPGLKVGYVSAVSELQQAHFKEIRVQPAVNFNAVEEVFVMTLKPVETAPGNED